MKKIASLFLCAFLLLTAAGCASHSNPFSAEEKLFSSDGMEITLTKAFRKTSVDGYTVCYDSSKVAVFALKEAFSLAEGLEEMTLDDYRELVLQANESKNPQRGDSNNGVQFLQPGEKYGIPLSFRHVQSRRRLLAGAVRLRKRRIR